MVLSGKQISIIIFFVMFVYSGFMKIFNFDKKVNVLGVKTKLPKIFNIIGMIGVIILEIIGSIILVINALNENLIHKKIVEGIYILYLLFLVVVTFLYHPPSSHMIPFLSNLTTFGAMMYIFIDTVY